MSATGIGLIAGLLLAIAGVSGGIPGLVFGVLLGGIGLAVGAHLDGRIDIGALLRGRGGRGKG